MIQSGSTLRGLLKMYLKDGCRKLFKSNKRKEEHLQAVEAVRLQPLKHL